MHLLAAKPGRDFRRERRRRSRPDARRDRDPVVGGYASSPALPPRNRGSAQARLTPSLPASPICCSSATTSRSISMSSKSIQHARLVILRLLGGSRYWPYGVEQLAAICRERGIAFAALPGDDRPDPELSAASTLPVEATHRLWRYCVEGGVENAVNLLGYAASLIGRETQLARADAVAARRALLAGPRHAWLSTIWRGRWQPGRPAAMLVFYRALIQAGNVAVIDALIAALDTARAQCHADLCHQPEGGRCAADFVAAMMERARPAIILNATAFALASPGARTYRHTIRCGGCARAAGRLLRRQRGRLAGGQPGSLGPRPRHACRPARGGWPDPVARGQLQGRGGLRSGHPMFDRRLSSGRRSHRFRRQLAANWARLREARPTAERRIAILLANYPNRDGRIGNGVGLDTPAGTVDVLDALAGEGYRGRRRAGRRPGADGTAAGGADE